MNTSAVHRSQLTSVIPQWPGPLLTLFHSEVCYSSVTSFASELGSSVSLVQLYFQYDTDCKPEDDDTCELSQI